MADQSNVVAFPPLPDDREAAVRYGLAQYQRLAADNEVLKTQLDAQILVNKELEVVNAGQAREIDDLRSRILDAERERAQAIADRADLEAVLGQMRFTLDAFEVRAQSPLRSRRKVLPAPAPAEQPVT